MFFVIAIRKLQAFWEDGRFCTALCSLMQYKTRHKPEERGNRPQPRAFLAGPSDYASPNVFWTARKAASPCSGSTTVEIHTSLVLIIWTLIPAFASASNSR